ncbi:DUF1343 domain-containing protein [Myxococcota bacterium]|jgi:uncharacterized protein YbbC (DUF1343 family)|nr:DUF1343 domain-containing protein [Myxococcota bacterium]
MTRPGASRFLEEADRRIGGRRWALLCHAASVDHTGRSILEPLCSTTALRPAFLLAPEHGLWGDAPYMVAVEDQEDPWWGVPVRSLYGHDAASLAPSAASLSGLDLLVVDLQDVGARYYTYLATMAMTLSACAEAGVSALVLDRPNPIGGLEVEGNLPRPHLRSFVSWLPLPNRHGITAGEAARMLVRQERLSLDLEVLPCEGWAREMTWPDTGLPFIPPSPNIPDWETALVYPGMCLLEGTNLSEGRGTPLPFRVFGAPWILDPRRLSDALNRLDLPGVLFRPLWFTPDKDKHQGKRCGGCHLVIRDHRAFRPLLAGFSVLRVVSSLWPDDFRLRTDAYEFVTDHPALDLLLGNRDLRHRLLESPDPREVWRTACAEGTGFLKDREPDLLYS